ncbi:FG-GAP-like repeat-containing protein [Saccharobesus litoralis]|uniref:FG-GAP-like repeat-containing protein n=1 Tax=Saccharobesus litoralis TaxID=2172099 RepID=UPI00131F2D01|nr:FG-GAP-like repeat-containing protein [Saccharobesus litoralis]
MPFFTLTWTNNSTPCSGGLHYRVYEYYNGSYTRTINAYSKSHNINAFQNGEYKYALYYASCSWSGESWFYGGSTTVLMEMSKSSTNRYGESVDIKDLDQKEKSFKVVWGLDPEDNITSIQVAQEFNGTLSSWTSYSNTTTSISKSNMANGVYRYHVKTYGTGGYNTRISASVRISDVDTFTSVNEGAASVSNDNVAVTAGKFRVNESGAATYSVPIQLPEGTAGVKPSVSLNYSSQGGNGQLGIGWSLAAGGAITRCPKNIALDGELGAITYTDEDRFCLGGVRLVANSGSYGGNGTKYHKRIDDFSEIQSFGSASVSGPMSFEVKTKSGDTYYYGNTKDSFVEPHDAATENDVAKFWALSRIEDVKGNTIDFFYSEVEEDGKHQLDRIEYGGNSTQGTSHYNKIQFHYTENPKPSAGYYAGSKFRTDELLDAIEVTINEDSFRYYQLNYFTSDVIEENNHLLEIHECISYLKTNCLSPLSFSWNRAVPKGTITNFVPYYDPIIGAYVTVPDSDLYNFIPFKSSVLLNAVVPAAALPTAKVIDMNGDGHVDIVYANDGWRINYGPNFNTSGTVISTMGSYGSDPENAKVIDYNGDGKLDLLVANDSDSNWYVMYYEPYTIENGECVASDGVRCYAYRDVTVSFKIENLGVQAVGFDDSTRIMDVDGDGLQDIVFVEGNYLKAYFNEYFKGGKFSVATTIQSFSSSPSLSYGQTKHTAEMDNAASIDFNGDGASDLLTNVITNNTGCIVNNSVVDTDYGTCIYGLRGQWTENTTHDWQVFLSERSNGTATLVHHQSLGNLGNSVRVADVNGDGLTDIVYHSGTTWYYRLSTGKSYSAAREFSFDVTNINADSTYFIDLNGDGRSDVLVPAGNNWEVYLSRPTSVHDLVYYSKRAVISRPQNAMIQFADVNSDGYIDLLSSTGSNWTVKYNYQQHFFNNVITEFDNGWGVTTNVTYDNLLNNDVYVSKSASDDKVISPVSPMVVVKRVESDITESNSLAISYEYGGLKFHRTGFGNLGFEMLATIDEQTGIKTVTQYYQDAENGIKTGLPVSTQQVYTDGNIVLSESINDIQTMTTSQGGYFPYIDSSTETSYQLTSNLTQAFINKTISGFVYDEWGNVKNSAVSVYDSLDILQHQTTNTNVYNGAGGGSKKGRLSTATVTKTCYADTCDSNSSMSKSSSFTYYPDDGLLESSTIDNLTTTYVYDDFGNKTSVSKSGKLNRDDNDPTTIVSSTTYSDNGRFIISTSASNLTTLIGYNDTTAPDYIGRVTKQTVTLPNDEVTTSYSDAWGVVYASKSVAAPYKYSRIKYCANFGCTASNAYYVAYEQQEGQPESFIEFDKFGRQILTKTRHFNGNWLYQRKQYNEQGRIWKDYIPSFSSSYPSYFTEYFYDELGRNNKVIQANGNFQQSYYLGLTTETEDYFGNITTQYNNVLGQIQKVVDALDGELEYQYNAYDNLVKVTKRSDNEEYVQVTNQYNAQGRKESMDDLDKGKWSYEYNDFGEIVYQKDAIGNETFTEYDEFARKRRVASDNSTQCWIYGASSHNNYGKGRLIETRNYESNLDCEASNPKQLTQLSYDSKGRNYHSKVTYTGVLGALDGSYHTYTSYDDYGRAYKTAYPMLGLTIEKTFNQYGYMQSIVNADTGREYQKIVDVDEFGNTREVEYANNTSVYNQSSASDGSIWRSTVYSPVGTKVHQLWYGYKKDGSLASREFDFSNRFRDYKEYYDYDALRRLEERRVTVDFGGTATENYVYNGFGDFITKAGKAFQFEDENRNRPSGFDGQSFAYNLNGDLEYANGNQIAYHSFNKPSMLTKDDSNWTRFSYGMGHSRYYRNDLRNQKNTHTLYLGGSEKVYTVSNGKHNFEYKFYVGDVVIRETVNQSKATESYLHKDHLGSPVSITDEDGIIVQRSIYDPWGKSTSITDSYSGLNLHDSVTFTGHETVSGIDIIHMNGRIYDPTIGRFLQADPHIQAPSNSQNYNRYSYVLNNPMSYTDPSGYFFKKLLKGVQEITGTGHILRALAGNKYLNMIAQVGLAVACGPAAPACMAAYSGAQTFAVTGSLNASIKSAGIAYATGKAFQQIGEYFNELGGDNLRSAIAGSTEKTYSFGGNLLTPEQIAGQISAHAIVGGIAAELQGGKFGHGFFSAGVTKGAGGVYLPGGSNLSTGEIAYGTVVSAVIGGTASVISGGKFANGAQTAAFQYLLNQAGESLKIGKATPEEAKILKLVRGLAQNAADEYDMACGASDSWTCGLPWIRGTGIHKIFADKIDQLGTDFSSEVSYLNGVQVPYGTKNSVRADAVFGSIASPKLVFELKTGFKSWLGRREAANYVENLPSNDWRLVVTKVN